MSPLASVTRVTSYFNEYARAVLPRDASICIALIKAHTPAEDRVEDGETYHYPEVIEVKFESWSNHWFSYRVRDGRWVPEGCNLNGEGLSTYRLMRRLIRELHDYRLQVELHREARETNCLVWGQFLVPMVNVDRHFFEHQAHPVFTIHTSDGNSSDWFGHSAEDALKNASGWLHHTPVAIELSHIRDARHNPFTLEEYEELLNQGVL
jgi:hypothetical protein